MTGPGDTGAAAAVDAGVYVGVSSETFFIAAGLGDRDRDATGAAAAASSSSYALFVLRALLVGSRTLAECLRNFGSVTCRVAAEPVTYADVFLKVPVGLSPPAVGVGDKKLVSLPLGVALPKLLNLPIRSAVLPGDTGLPAIVLSLMRSLGHFQSHYVFAKIDEKYNKKFDV